MVGSPPVAPLNVNTKSREVPEMMLRGAGPDRVGSRGLSVSPMRQ